MTIAELKSISAYHREQATMFLRAADLADQNRDSAAVERCLKQQEFHDKASIRLYALANAFETVRPLLSS